MPRRRQRTPRASDGEPTATLATRIPKALHRRLRLYCVEHGINAQEVVEQAIRKRLARSGPASGG
jgi:hypothetical protein